MAATLLWGRTQAHRSWTRFLLDSRWQTNRNSPCSLFIPNQSERESCSGRFLLVDFYFLKNLKLKFRWSPFLNPCCSILRKPSLVVDTSFSQTSSMLIVNHDMHSSECKSRYDLWLHNVTWFDKAYNLLMELILSVDCCCCYCYCYCCAGLFDFSKQNAFLIVQGYRISEYDNRTSPWGSSHTSYHHHLFLIF